MNEQIGLVLWGCKGGYRIFCSNSIVSTNDKEIAQTVKDTRSFFRIHRTGHDFYAIEFTSRYKVFTIYRSSNDSGTGAFIAATIYVPHNIKVKNMRAMLREIMDNYFNEYMNPLSNTPLTGKYDDINKFTPIVSRYDTVADRPCYHLPSVQDDTPQIVLYDDLSVVDLYFDSPYRPEFFQCQEVMFISKEIYAKASDYKVEFVTKPTIIEKISEPEEESKLFNNLAELKLTRLVINGSDMLPTGGNCVLSETDSISFTIEKNENYEPFAVECFTAKEAVSRGFLRRRKNRKDFEFVPPSSPQWKARTYYLIVVNQGLDISKLEGNLFLWDGRKRFDMKPLSGHWCFVLNGDEADEVYSLRLTPYKDKKDALSKFASNSGIIIAQDIQPKTLSSTGIRTSIVEKVIRKTTKDPAQYQATLQFENYKSRITVQSDRLSLLVPSQRSADLSVTFDADDFDAQYDGGDEVSFTPTHMTIYVERDVILENIFNKMELKLVVGGNSYKNSFDAKKRMVFRPTFNDWLKLKKGEKGHLYYKEFEYEYSLDSDCSHLWIHALIVILANKLSSVRLTTTQNDAEPHSYTMTQNMYKILPLGCELSVDESFASILDDQKGKYVVIKKIWPITPLATFDEKNEKDEKDEKEAKDISLPPQKRREIIFKKCQGFLIDYNNREIYITEQVQSYQMKGDIIHLCNKRHNPVCIVRHGRNENLVQGRTKNHFKVIWKDEDHCDVEYVKESFLDKLMEYKKWLAGLGAFILMACLAVVALPFVKKLFASDDVNYVYNITLKAEDPSAKIKDVSFSRESRFCQIQEVNGENTITISVPKDSIDYFKKQWKNPKLIIQSDGDGDTTVDFFDVIERQDFDTFFDKNKKEYEKSSSSIIVFPSKVLLDSLQKIDIQNREDLVKFAEAAAKYPAKGKEFSNLAFDIVKKHKTDNGLLDKKWLEKYLSLYKDTINFEPFKSKDVYQVAREAKANIERAQKEQERLYNNNKQNEESGNQGGNAFQANGALIDQWKKTLNKTGVTEEEVKNIQKQMKKQTIENQEISNHCTALTQWFTQHKINNNLVNFLSRDQKSLYEFYRNHKSKLDEKNINTFPKIQTTWKKAKDAGGIQQ